MGASSPLAPLVVAWLEVEEVADVVVETSLVTYLLLALPVVVGALVVAAAAHDGILKT